MSELELAGARTILVVDDVSVVRRVVHRLLTEAGFRVFEAGDAAEALEVLETTRIKVDLVIVDVIMEGVHGVDLVKCIRRRWPDQRVVYMSAFPAEVLVQHGLRDPQVIFLAKPFTREELLAKVHAAFRAGAPSPRPEARANGDAGPGPG